MTLKEKAIEQYQIEQAKREVYLIQSLRDLMGKVTGIEVCRLSTNEIHVDGLRIRANCFAKEVVTEYELSSISYYDPWLEVYKNGDWIPFSTLCQLGKILLIP